LQEFLLPRAFELRDFPEYAFKDAFCFFEESAAKRSWSGPLKTRADAVDFVAAYTSNLVEDLLARTEQYNQPTIAAAQMGSSNWKSAKGAAQRFVKLGREKLLEQVAIGLHRPVQEVRAAALGEGYDGALSFFTNPCLWKEVVYLATSRKEGITVWNDPRLKNLRTFLKRYELVTITSVEAEEGVKFVKRTLLPQQRRLDSTGSRLLRLHLNTEGNCDTPITEEELKCAWVEYRQLPPSVKLEGTEDKEVEITSLQQFLGEEQHLLLKEKEEEKKRKKEREELESANVPAQVLTLTVAQLTEKARAKAKEQGIRTIPTVKHELRLFVGGHEREPTQKK
jgi:hypothetical protein